MQSRAEWSEYHGTEIATPQRICVGQATRGAVYEFTWVLTVGGLLRDRVACARLFTCEDSHTCIWRRVVTCTRLAASRLPAAIRHCTCLACSRSICETQQEQSILVKCSLSGGDYRYATSAALRLTVQLSLCGVWMGTTPRQRRRRAHPKLVLAKE